MGPPAPRDSWGGMNGGGKTHAWDGGRTPNPYADSSRTPAWGAGGRTPNLAMDGGKTPAWNAGARTPAWNAARTPNPYASGARVRMAGGRLRGVVEGRLHTRLVEGAAAVVEVGVRRAVRHGAQMVGRVRDVTLRRMIRRGHIKRGRSHIPQCVITHFLRL